MSERSLEKTSCEDRDISGVSYDSRNVKNGDLYVAIRGEKHDGHHFIRDVLGKGAVAVVHELSDAEHGTGESGMHSSTCFIQVENSRKALACISNNFYQRPSEQLTLIGITGTNGKTTSSYILKSILEAHGHTAGLIGTIHYIIKEKLYSALHTTPESPEFQSLLHTMLVSGCTIVVSEISSHALAQYRVDGAIFQTAVFTNLTRDHLDFHKTMEDYFRAKERLFTELLDRNGTAVINIDDQYGKRLASQLRTLSPELTIVTCGLKNGADMVAHNIQVSFRGIRFTLSYRDSRYDVSSPLLGLPNVYNIMSAAAAALSLGVPWQMILQGIRQTGTVTGRFQKLDAGQGFLCIIDYAHTEDALERLILTAKKLISLPHPSLKKGGYQEKPRIITVFGCGGDRDKGKRPKMGEVSTKLSDFVIITSDNPRSEDPAEIIKHIEEGTVHKNYLIESDRAKAIQKAVDLAEEGDIVLVA
ncbi:MAG: UDP-N-acetylmuramoyl-L-alanyl-D-glutamate--2,6-diaminopimelate ligase, partial [Chlorobiaceae bacterium]|nr:UDP-N-acetylmuramoyl-L-alanyl-D-glutamate--2,6-diaminopimelate ligase [Chlorobiaceae bacterium]